MKASGAGFGAQLKAASAAGGGNIPPGQLMPQKRTITLDDIEEELRNDENQPQKNAIVMGLYGSENTAKTGIAMDCRSQEEKDNGMKIFVISFDQSSQPIKKYCHGDDPNIIVRTPLMFNEDNKIDWPLTFAKTFAYMRWLKERADLKEFKAIILDGMGDFLKMCEFAMKKEDMLIQDMSTGIKGFDWAGRNIRYYDVLHLAKSLGIEVYIIAHYRKETSFVPTGKTDSRGKPKVKMQTDEVAIPNWHRGNNKETDSELYQKVHCYRKETDLGGGIKEITFEAVVEKTKSNIALAGKRFTIGKVIQYPEHAEVSWQGLMGQLRPYIENPVAQGIVQFKKDEAPAPQPMTTEPAQPSAQPSPAQAQPEKTTSQIGGGGLTFGPPKGGKA